MPPVSAQPPGSEQNGKRPPPTPISAGAFSFNLGKSSTKKPNRPVQNVTSVLYTPTRPTSRNSEAESSSAALLRHGATGPSKTAHMTSTGASKSEQVVDHVKETPRKSMFQTIDALPSPLGKRRVSESPFMTPASKLVPLQPFTSSTKKTPVGVRKLNHNVDDISPFRVDKKRAAELEGDVIKKRTKLGDAGEFDKGSIVESIERRGREAQIKDEDEGVGVSPRKSKAVKWPGQGPVPLTLQLSSSLQSANSSVLLFYTSMQRILFPPPQKIDSRTSNVTRPVTPAQHLRTAPLVLKLESVSVGRSHQGVMVTCSIVHRDDASAQEALIPEENSTNQEGTEGAIPVIGPPSSAKVMVIFHPVPPQCPRLGADSRHIERRLLEIQNGVNQTRGGWEAGIWRPFTEIEMTMPPNPASMDLHHPSTDPDKTDPPVQSAQKTVRVIFASRYLIAETK